MRRYLAIVLLLALTAPASAAAIDIGQIFGTALQPYIDALVSAAIAGIVGWWMWALNKFLGVKTEDSSRDALIAFADRQAHALVAKGVVKLNGLKVNVQSDALAAAANTGLTAIPGALTTFGITPEKARTFLEDRIVAAIPKVASVAQAQAVAIYVANPTTPAGIPPGTPLPKAT